MNCSILWIHGFGGSPESFGYLKLALPKHDSILAHYTSGPSIEDTYESVLSSLNIDEPVHIVGHSLGGIIGYLLASRGEIPVKSLTSISTPFGGSDMANKLKWFYPSMRIFSDLSPKSAIIKEVQTPLSACPFISLISTHGNLPFMSPPNDGVVSIASQETSVAKKKIKIDVNHFEILQSPKSTCELKKFIFRSYK
jgi:pimeloyl-ACP methyl ester carboxylesterase